jgi:hypothetical protein
LHCCSDVLIPDLHVNNLLQAPRFKPPDVWFRLVRGLLRVPACRQALLKLSPAAAAAPAELMLAQLAATLAGELDIKQGKQVIVEANGSSDEADGNSDDVDDSSDKADEGSDAA